MYTELNVVQQEITPGRKVDVVENNVRNFRLHRCARMLDRLMIYMLEMDSNNMSGNVIPSDAATIRSWLDEARREFEFCVAEENNDAPRAEYESSFILRLPHQKEVARITNYKVEACLTDVMNLTSIMLSVDSANSQSSIMPPDADKIRRAWDICDRAMDRWIGKGSSFQDLGEVALPTMDILGQIRPSLNADYKEVIEPSKDRPKTRLPDAPDIPND